MADPNYAKLLLEGHVPKPVDPKLTADEKLALNRMMAPEGALWKIMSAALANADQLRDGIAMIPLVDPADVTRARQLQLHRQAVIDLLGWIAAQLQPQPLPQQG